MALTRKRSSLVIAVVIALMALPMAAHSALVGSVATSDGSVFGGGNWETDVRLGWSVADVDDNYLYSYTFQAPSQASGLSHFILQTSLNFESDNIWGNSNGYELKTYSPEDPGNSNPGLPGDLYGLKFGEFGSTEGSIGEWNFNFTSDRAPMVGDFYAKGGEDSFAFNSGFGEGVGGAGAKILVPDTLIQRVPEAGALLLFSTGLIGLVGYRRVRRMQ